MVDHVYMPLGRSLARWASPGPGRSLARGLCFAAAALLFSTASAEADTTSTTIEVRARVVASCTVTTTRLTINVPRGATAPGFGSTNFTVNCPGASAINQVPARFTFSPSDGSSAFVIRKGGADQMPYELCHDTSCAQQYVSGTPGPVFSITNPSYIYSLRGKAYPPSTGAKPGTYKQDVDVTLTY